MSVKVEVKLSGKARGVLDSIIAKLNAKAPVALQAAAKLIYDESQVLVPQETGYLKETGEITTKGTGLETTKSIEYGNSRHPEEERTVLYGPNAGKRVRRYPYEYAHYVHEIAASFGGNLQGRGYDYLRSAVRTQREQCKKVIIQMMGA